MTVDWKKEALDPVYAEFGVAATIKVGNLTLAIKAIPDRREGQNMIRGFAETQSEQRIALVRMADLVDADLVPVDKLEGGSISIKGVAWPIVAVETEPLPDDDSDGEVILVLEDGR